MKNITRKDLLEADNLKKCRYCIEIIKGQAIFQNKKSKKKI